jgi:hypothetical protein
MTPSASRLARSTIHRLYLTSAFGEQHEEALCVVLGSWWSSGDQLKSIRAELDQVAFDIYDEVGETRVPRSTHGTVQWKARRSHSPSGRVGAPSRGLIRRVPRG